jgi:type II secretory pathway pseudopilin PulG
MEILIVTVIVGMLGVLLMRTYVTMTRIAFRVQQEKQVTEQAVMLTQIVQNLADSMTIDYDRYKTESGTNYLTLMSGLVDTLYLTDGTQTVTLGTTGDCQSQVAYMTGVGCAVVLQYASQDAIILTQTGRANITPLQFKIIPYAAAADYFADPSLCPVNLGSCLYHP